LWLQTLPRVFIHLKPVQKMYQVLPLCSILVGIIDHKFDFEPVTDYFEYQLRVENQSHTVFFGDIVNNISPEIAYPLIGNNIPSKASNHSRLYIDQVWMPFEFRWGEGVPTSSLKLD